jgi:hypothetical protein
MSPLAYFLVGLGSGILTSFLGSFGSFIIWVHFDFEERWEARKYRRHAAKLKAAEPRHGIHYLDD